MRHLLLRTVPLAAALALSPVAARAQDVATAVRFEITHAGDSTFSFGVGANRWVAKGQRGLAVDPRRRDVLVARFLVLRVSRDTATALVTGATTPVTSDHVALLDRPAMAWWRRTTFWIGAVAGAAAGLLAGLAL